MSNNSLRRFRVQLVLEDGASSVDDTISTHDVDASNEDSALAQAKAEFQASDPSINLAKVWARTIEEIPPQSS